MTSLRLRAIKAKHGDSMLLFADGATVLIDGGPSGVYNRFLREQLSQLNSTSEEAPLVDLMMVSHIDADHIDGILDLTAELLEARDEDRDPVVRIGRAWHNSFADMISKAADTGSPSQVNAEAASAASIFDEFDIAGFDPHESKLVLSSVAQGRRLRLDLKALNIEINQRFKNRLALQDNAKAPWVCGSLALEIIGPTESELEKLKKEWAKKLKEILAKEADAETAALSLDTSVSNLSSIVVIAESEGKKALLTGDARGDMVLDWLGTTGKLDANGKVHFDILKLPHHGSDRNVSKEFFEQVTADKYVVSGDGGHGNPEPRTLEMLFEARPSLDYKIFMTYGPDELKQHKKYIKEKNDVKLDKVLNTEERRNVLKYPKNGTSFIDVTA